MKLAQYLKTKFTDLIPWKLRHMFFSLNCDFTGKGDKLDGTNESTTAAKLYRAVIVAVRHSMPMSMLDANMVQIVDKYVPKNIHQLIFHYSISGQYPSGAHKAKSQK